MHRTCPGRLAIALLLAALASLCHAQPQPPTTENQARYYVYGAFLTHAVPEIMGERVALGPELEQRLGVASGADRLRIYDALMTYTDGKPLDVRRATADELANYKRSLKQPVFRVQAGEIALLVEYDMQANTIPFVGQLGVASRPPVAAVPAPRAAPPVAPSAPPVAPPPVATTVPKPPPPVIATVPKPAPAAEPLKPNGPCIVRAVMSEQDLVNCRASAARLASPPPPPPPAPKPQARVAPPPPPPAQPELKPNGPCEVKPVMSEQDLVNCRAGASVLRRVDPGPPVVAKPQARVPEETVRKPATPCVIKPVMSEEDRIACGMR